MRSCLTGLDTFRSGPSPPVEVIDVGASAGEHDGVLTGEPGCAPIGDEPGSGLVGVVTEGDAAVVSVGSDGGVDVAVA